MLIIHSIFGLANLACILAFFLMNVSIGDSSGEGMPLLLLSIFFSTLTLGVLILSIEEIRVNKSLFFILLFFIYILIKGFFDLEKSSNLKELTIGTTSGIFLFFYLGFSVYLGIYSLFFVKSNQKLNKIFLYVRIFFIFFIYIILLRNIVSVIVEGMRSDIVLMTEHNNSYQRPANLLTIAFIILSYIYLLHMYKSSETKFFFKKIVNLLLSILYISIGIFQMFLIQVIGSNTGMVMILAIMAMTLPFVLLTSISSRRMESLNNYIKRIRTNLLTFKWQPLIINSLKTIIVLIVVVYCFIWYFDFDISKTRFFGFGQSDGFASRSFETRGKILQENLLIHLTYNPVFGNMLVDHLTTGKGTFVHSLILSVQTHLGIFGSIFFFLILKFNFSFIMNAYNRIYFNVNSNKYLSNSIKIYSVVLLMFIIISGSFSTFYTWAPFWFSLGLFGTFLYQKREEIQ